MRTSGLKRLVLAYLLALPAAALAITPVDGGSVSGTDTTVNDFASDQTDPHVSGDLTSYTDGPITDRSIRYYSFSTAIDQAVPRPAGAIDFLSDVSGSRIAFTRVFPDRTAIMVYNTAGGATVEVDPQPGSNRIGSAIGNTTVAFIDFGIGAGRTYAYDLAGGGAVLLDSGTGFSTSQNPAVAPNGNVVVWEQCAGNIVSCEVWQATRTAGAWGAAALVASGAANPHTDGVNVVYDSAGDIFYRPVSGGAAVQLQLSGTQTNPSISSGVIGFESSSGGAPDLFVYVIATNTMFRVTNTPTVVELLNNISVLPDGDVRIVWAANDGVAGDLNIYARTFTVPLSLVDTIPELIALVEGLNLRQGISNSLDAKLENAQKALERAKAGDTGSACHLMDAFINEVNAQEGHELSEAQADRLRNGAAAIKTALGCA